MQKDRTTSSAILRQDVSFTENHNYTRGKQQFGIRLLQNWTAAGLFDQFLYLIFVWDLYQENMGMRRQICLFCAADSRASSACAVYAHICSPQLALQTTSQLQDEIDHFHTSSSIYAWWAWLRSISPPKDTEMADEIAVPNQPPLFIVTTVLAVVVYGYLILQNPKFRITGNALFIYAISLLLSFSSMPLHHTFKAVAVIPLRPIIMIEAILPEQAEDPSYIHFVAHYYQLLRCVLGMYRGDPGGIAAPECKEPSNEGIGSVITSMDPVPINVTGHFNDIFLGYHETFGQVALRRPRISDSNYADAIRRFHKEASAWKSLRHPCILPFLGTLFRDGHIYFISPFAENGNLLEYVVDRPQVNRIQLLCGVAHAIVYLHGRGIVHGDIKASNVLINNEGCPLLCDFGLVKMPGTNTSIERKGAGSLRWQSSELWFNEPRSSASDTYAFAMTIVETLTGDVPFASLNNEVAVMLAVVAHDERPLTTPRASPTGVSYENAWEVAVSCWPKLPQDRISMAEALWRLREDSSLAIDSVPRLRDS